MVSPFLRHCDMKVVIAEELLRQPQSLGLNFFSLLRLRRLQICQRGTPSANRSECQTEARIRYRGALAVVGYLFAIGAGVSFVFQQAVNANLSAEIGSRGRALSAFSAARSSCLSSR
jgi:hypothetical protein